MHHPGVSAATVREVLTALATMPQAPTDWEAGFVQSLLRGRGVLSPTQLAVLQRMADRYVDPGLAAELRGQQRLF